MLTMLILTHLSNDIYYDTSKSNAKKAANTGITWTLTQVRINPQPSMPSFWDAQMINRSN